MLMRAQDKINRRHIIIIGGNSCNNIIAAVTGYAGSGSWQACISRFHTTACKLTGK